MKFLLFIFALYLTALPCMSCKDADSADAAEMKQTIIKSSSHSCNGHSEETCNPFCSCNCCGSRIVQHYQTDFFISEQIVTLSKQKTLLRGIPLYNSFSGNIWQPPKIS